MKDNPSSEPNPLLRPDVSSADLGALKDWDAFDACGVCHGRAQILETPETDLFCAECKARLPRPEV